MFKPQITLLITALAYSSVLAAPPVRKFDDPGAPPFTLLKEGEKPPLDGIGDFRDRPEVRARAGTQEGRWRSRGESGAIRN
jgi:hypothetical protein